MTRNGDVHGVSTFHINKNTTGVVMQFSAITTPVRLLLQHSKTLLAHNQMQHLQMVRWRQAHKQSDVTCIQMAQWMLAHKQSYVTCIQMVEWTYSQVSSGAHTTRGLSSQTNKTHIISSITTHFHSNSLSHTVHCTGCSNIIHIKHIQLTALQHFFWWREGVVTWYCQYPWPYSSRWHYKL